MRNKTLSKWKSALIRGFQKVCCFCKETVRIAKLIFARHADDIHYHDLGPIDNASECAEHIRALKWAVSNPRIRNIALTGPFGSGKSSIINTFLRENPVLREQSICTSLATFANVNQDSAFLRTSLPQSILQQPFYKVEQRRIPQSRYRKLYKVHLWPFGVSLTVLGYLSSLFIRIFCAEWFTVKWEMLVDFGTSCGLTECTSTALFHITVLVLLWLLASLIRKCYSHLSIREIKFSDHAAVDTKGGDIETIFNKDLDEIVYFFEETGFRMVFFEDLDRFEYPSIFIQLRELNTLLNNYNVLQQTIVFIYSIKDDIFERSERTKFFDFILPVIPIINSTNSDEAFRQLLQDGVPHEIPDGFVKDVSPVISDMRVLQNIYNEFLLYRTTLKSLQNLRLRDEPMMALIVFKNLYPKAFADLQAETGIVKQAFHDKVQFIRKQVTDYRNNAQEIRDTLENIDQDCLKNIREVKLVMLHALSRQNGVATSLRRSPAPEISAEKILSDDFDVQYLQKDGNWYLDIYIPLEVVLPVIIGQIFLLSAKNI